MNLVHVRLIGAPILISLAPLFVHSVANGQAPYSMDRSYHEVQFSRPGEDAPRIRGYCAEQGEISESGMQTMHDCARYPETPMTLNPLDYPTIVMVHAINVGAGQTETQILSLYPYQYLPESEQNVRYGDPLRCKIGFPASSFQRMISANTRFSIVASFPIMEHSVTDPEPPHEYLYSLFKVEMQIKSDTHARNLTLTCEYSGPRNHGSLNQLLRFMGSPESGVTIEGRF